MLVCLSVQLSSPDLCGTPAQGQAGEKHGRHTGTRQMRFFGGQASRGEAACKAFANVTSLEMGSAESVGAQAVGRLESPQGNDLFADI